MKSKSLFFAAALAGTVSVLCADDATEALATAKSAYEAGNYSEAIQSLDYASTLIRQKKAEAVVKLLPAAPAGWTAEEAESEGGSQALVGGIVGAKRSYHKESGGSLRVEIQSDSPLLQSLGMMFSNPMLMASSGAKLESYKGQKLAVTYKTADKAGEVKCIVDNRYFVNVEGNDLSREELLAFVKTIDFAGLAALK